MKKILRIIYIVIIIIIIIICAYVFAQFLYQQAKGPCYPAIGYKIGIIDEQYNISHDDMLHVVQYAERVWEDHSSLEQLFYYDEQASLSINLIYDERQERFEESQERIELIDNRKVLITKKNQSYEKDVEQYEDSLRVFNAMNDTYSMHAETHSDEVEGWNRQGGISENIFYVLKSKEKDLKREYDRLQIQLEVVNRLAMELNKESSSITEQYVDVNQDIALYNDDYGDSYSFDQGTFTADEINIYHFSQYNDLALVIAHELGHSLGIDHVASREAVMYPTLGAQNIENISLHQDDVEALYNICKIE